MKNEILKLVSFSKNKIILQQQRGQMLPADVSNMEAAKWWEGGMLELMALFSPLVVNNTGGGGKKTAQPVSIHPPWGPSLRRSSATSLLSQPGIRNTCAAHVRIMKGLRAAVMELSEVEKSEKWWGKIVLVGLGSVITNQCASDPQFEFWKSHINVSFATTFTPKMLPAFGTKP